MSRDGDHCSNSLSKRSVEAVLLVPGPRSVQILTAHLALEKDLLQSLAGDLRTLVGPQAVRQHARSFKDLTGNRALLSCVQRNRKARRLRVSKDTQQASITIPIPGLHSPDHLGQAVMVLLAVSESTAHHSAQLCEQISTAGQLPATCRFFSPLPPRILFQGGQCSQCQIEDAAVTSEWPCHPAPQPSTRERGR